MSAGWDLIGPGAHAAFPAVSQARGALVAAGLAVPAAPEDVTLGLIGEDSVQARAIPGADWGLCRINVNN